MAMTIRIDFPDPLDAPGQRSPLRVRYSLRPDGHGRTAPVLTYGHGQAVLTRETWAAWRMVGAAIRTDTEREQAIVAEVLDGA